MDNLCPMYHHYQCWCLSQERTEQVATSPIIATSNGPFDMVTLHFILSRILPCGQVYHHHLTKVRCLSMFPYTPSLLPRRDVLRVMREGYEYRLR